MARGSPSSRGGDLGHRRGVLGGQPELRPDRLGALDEQPDRLGPAEGVEVRGPPRVGQVQRRHDQLLLAPEGERGPGGDQHPDLRGGRQQLLDHRAGRGHLLEVVHDQQELTVPEVVAQGLKDGAAGRLGDAEGPGQDRGDQLGVGDRGQVGEEGAIAVAGPQRSATWRARRDLPVPPAPVRVSSRARPSSRTASAATRAARFTSMPL
jgi:hypothetical protein